MAWIRFHYLILQWKFKLCVESLLEVIRQNIAGWFQHTFCFQKFINNIQQCFAFTPQENFSAHYLNFHWRWWDRIQATFWNIFYFTLIRIFVFIFCTVILGYLGSLLWFKDTVYQFALLFFAMSSGFEILTQTLFSRRKTTCAKKISANKNIAAAIIRKCRAVTTACHKKIIMFWSFMHWILNNLVYNTDWIQPEKVEKHAVFSHNY